MGLSRRRLRTALVCSALAVLATGFAAAAYGLPLASSAGTGDGVYAEFDEIQADQLYYEQQFALADGGDCGVVRLTMEDATLHDAVFYGELPHPTSDEVEELALEFQDDPVEVDSMGILVRGLNTSSMEFDTSASVGDGSGVLGVSGAATLHDVRTVVYDFNVEDFDHGLRRTEFESEIDGVEDVGC